MNQSKTRVDQNRTHFLCALVTLLVAGAVLSAPADARSVRVESNGWTEESATGPGAIGFNFLGFGDTAAISGDGQVSIGSSTLSPFFFGADPDLFGFTWSNTAGADPGDPSAFPVGSGILNGFRVTWTCADQNECDATAFQLGVFDLGGGQFAMEFNYDGLSPLDGAFIGYDLGDGAAFDMLAALGFTSVDQWQGFSEEDSMSGDSFCPEGTPPTALACNNYDFSSTPPDFGLPDGYAGYFQSNNDGSAPLGRYFFLLTAATEVPEPGTGLMLLT
ncbi:MAG: hypothetical protein WBO47_10570, partial [Gammaproteobacteria bacterium]